MQQSRLSSLIEACLNVLIGFAVAFLSQLIVFPLVGIKDVSFSTNLEIGAYFTLISLIRSYIIRRWFNARLHRAAEALAARAE